MNMHAYSYLGRPSSMNGNRYQQHHPSMESAPAIWQHRQTVPKLLDGMLPPHQRILSEDINDTNNGSMRGVGLGSLRIPPAILGSSDSMNRGSSGSIQAAQCSSSELFDSIKSIGQYVDPNDTRYSLLLPSATMASSNGQQKQTSGSVGGGAGEGPMICELIGKLGGTSSNGFLSSGPSPSQQHLERGVDSLAAAVKFGGTARNHCWNSSVNATAEVERPSNLTVDPSKGELSLNHGAVIGAGLATSHCLSPFTADPGFAERAARFSSFSNGNSAQTFSSDSESVGPARKRLNRSGAPQLCPRNSSCLSLQQETVGRVISNDSAASELRLADSSRTREIQSDGRGSVLVDLVASVATVNINDDDHSSLKHDHAQVEWGRDSEKLSRTVSNLMGSESNGGEAGAELPTNTPIDHGSSDRMQASSFTSEQSNFAGPVEVCPSPGGRSAATDISVKKRKHNFEEKPTSKHMGSGSGFRRQDDKDAKMTESEEAKAKRIRRRDGKDDMKDKVERTSSETSGESSPRPTKLSSEQPKTDYIHVRARRGQATDSHSLAERVRREKISERMKFLQDLVPGCGKVTGKAGMLDEIINYVQSLQHQVEFLSMKLAYVNPRLDLHHESFLSKEVTHRVSQAIVVSDPETSIAYAPLQPKHRTPLQQGLEYQLQAEAAIRRSMSAMPIIPAANPSVGNFEDGVRQIMWDDGDSDLNSVVQMGFGNSQATSSQGLQFQLPPGQVKVELQQSPITCL